MTPESLGSLIPLLLIVLAFWLLVIRPARRRQHEMTRIQNSVTIGSEVMLGSGLFGTVVSIGDDTLGLSIAPGTEVKVARQAVVRVIEPAAEQPSPEENDTSDGPDGSPAS